MIEIRRWDTGATCYRSETATSLAYAVIEAVRAGADLYRARLDGASLYGARLDGANLVGARLYGARLDGANLVGANLVGANLVGARLDGASLEPIRADVYAILDAAPAEVPALRAALSEGRFDGSHYEGECACLVGTIANARGCSYKAVPDLVPNSDRPAERWALAIRAADTPQTNPIAAITLGWIDAWLSSRAQVST